MRCEYCGAGFGFKFELKRHMKMEEDVFVPGKEGVDYIRCCECGLRGRQLGGHIHQVHQMTAKQYLQKYPCALLALRSVLLRDAGGRMVCKYCGGKFSGKVLLHKHLKKERDAYINGLINVDYLVCGECGMRCDRLDRHVVNSHGMAVSQYLQKYPDSVMILPKLLNAIAKANLGKAVVPLDKKVGVRTCEKCGGIYDSRKPGEHFSKCVAANPEKYALGLDYVACPECQIPLLSLTGHLQRRHGWDRARIGAFVVGGGQLQSGCAKRRWQKAIREKYGVDNCLQAPDVQEKIRVTCRERFGVDNVFLSPEVQGRIKVTNMERYGTPFPMQNEKVRIRQTQSAQQGPSTQEVFFDEHTPDNVVYTGYGGRFIRVKTGVHKFGREIKTLNPDFIVVPGALVESAGDLSKQCLPFDDSLCDVKYVVELLGDYYHSEKVIGIAADEHEAEVVAAYRSVDTECLVLWEHDVLKRWVIVEPMVKAWIEKAVVEVDMNWRMRNTTGA